MAPVAGGFESVVRVRVLAAALAAVAGVIGPTGVASSAGPRPTTLPVPGDLGRVPASWKSSCRLAPGTPLTPTSEVRVRRGVRYAAGVRLDLYLPVNGSSRRPVVLAVHGGGWRYGDRGGMAWTATRLARAGFVVAAPDYTLATLGHPTYPRPVGQLRGAVRFLRAAAAHLGADPSRIGVLGSSAGGQLALLVADASDGPCTAGERVAAVVAWSAPLDLPRLAQCAPGRCALEQLTAGFLGCGAADCPELWDAASPVTAASPDDPPALLFTSAREFVPAEQAGVMTQALRAASVPTWLVRLPGHRHASGYRGDAIGPTVTFLERVLTGRR